MRLISAAIAAATLVSTTPSLAQSCSPMANAAVGVDTGVTDAVPQRCDEARKCRMFAINGQPIGEVGDSIVPRTSSANGIVGVQAKRNGLQGYMTSDGAWKVEAQFKQTGPYWEERAAVQRVDGLWVYVDPQGHEVGTPWDAAEAFTEGLGLVTSYKGGHDFRHGYVDTSGKVVIPVTFAAARLFSEGLAAVRVGGKWGYIDHNGKMVIPPRFTEADTFHNGRAVVSLSEDWGKNGLIDRNGKFVVEPRNEQISKVGEKFWSIGGVDRTYRGNGEPPLLARLVDAEGHFVSKQVYNSFGAVEDGLMSVCRNDRCGYMDTTGKVVIPLKYKGAGDFQEGLAAVTTDGEHYGFIDRTGKLVLAARYESRGPHNEQFTPGPFVKGLAPAGCQERWGFIDKNGAWAIPPVYRFAESFDNGFANVEVKTGTAHLRADGSAIDFTPDEVDAEALPAQPCGVPLAHAPE